MQARGMAQARRAQVAGGSAMLLLPVAYPQASQDETSQSERGESTRAREGGGGPGASARTPCAYDRRQAIQKGRCARAPRASVYSKSLILAFLRFARSSGAVGA
jgi:hypothetical protein